MTTIYTAAPSDLYDIADAADDALIDWQERTDDLDEIGEAELALGQMVCDARNAAVQALIDCPEAPRLWKISEEGYEYDTMTGTLEEAIEYAEDGVTRSNYDGDGGVLYIDGYVSCELTGEHEGWSVTLDEPEPACRDGHEHDWRAPQSVVGGIADNPGVYGHGGGVTIAEMCVHCGRYRDTDTWAQRPDTGEQGLHEVTYRDADDDSRAWVASQAGDEDEA